MTRLELQTLEAMRHSWGKAILVSITDRCPVGCDHCSVDSRPESPTIRDVELFNSLVKALAQERTIETVGISGGEPFVERRALAETTECLAAANKFTAVYTSGYWAKAPGKVSSTISRTLTAVDTVVLSTDAFHAQRLRDDTFLAAMHHVVQHDGWLIIQAIDTPAVRTRVDRLLDSAFGSDHDKYAEVNYISLLPYGRAAKLLHDSRPRLTASELGACLIARAPVLRYNGDLLACCGEQVVAGQGPESMRRSVRTQGDLREALLEFLDDSHLRGMSDLGAEVLTALPATQHLQDRHFHDICEFCWVSRAAVQQDPNSERLLQVALQISRSSST